MPGVPLRGSIPRLCRTVRADFIVAVALSSARDTYMRCVAGNALPSKLAPMPRLNTGTSCGQIEQLGERDNSVAYSATSISPNTRHWSAVKAEMDRGFPCLLSVNLVRSHTRLAFDQHRITKLVRTVAVLREDHGHAV
jgi:hypothetical protein